VAVTNGSAGRAARRRRMRRLWRDLPWIAAGIGSLAARNAFAQESSVDTRVLFYKESGGRTQVLDPMILLKKDLGEEWGQLGLVVGYDAISGASPTGGYPTSDVTTSASGRLVSANTFPQADYRDTRFSSTLSYGRRFGAHLPTVDVSYAKENDYVARSIGLTDEWTVAHGLGTLHFGASFARDIVSPVTNKLHLPKSQNGFSLGYTWILGERDLVDVSVSLMRLSGYLDDPYKVVPIGDPPTTTVPDHRPDTRSRRAVVAKYGHHYLWDGALKVTYRYYNDDWSIQAHTLEVVYDQHLFTNWLVTPQIRLYTQTGASFYGSRFSSPQTFLSSDYRLSPLDSALGGLTVTRKLTDSLSVNLGGTYQYQRGRDRVIPIPGSRGGDGEEGPTASSASAADMTVFTVTAGFTKRF
jgi:Protein of unknown function (DUF3570)